MIARFTLAAWLLVCPPVFAASVTASWDPVTLDVDGRPESVSHYMLYYSETPRPAGVTHPGDGTFGYDHAVNVGNVTRVQQNDLTGGRTYYFAVAAVDTSGNLSAYSDEVRLEVPIGADGGVPDAGEADAGPDTGPADADSSSDRVEGGCGCRSFGAGASGMWILLALGLLRIWTRSVHTGLGGHPGFSLHAGTGSAQSGRPKEEVP